MGKLISLQDAAARLGVSRKTIERMIAAGQLVKVKVRGCSRVREGDVERLIAGSRVPA